MSEASRGGIEVQATFIPDHRASTLPTVIQAEPSPSSFPAAIGRSSALVGVSPGDAAGPSQQTVGGMILDGVLVLLAVLFAIASTVFGCSGGVSVGSSNPDPNRALGTYAVPQPYGESQSRIFFGYWLSGNNQIPASAAAALRDAIGPTSNTAMISIVPSSILYEETAVEVSTGRLIKVSITGTWTYESRDILKVNWGSTVVTESTFPPAPPFAVAVPGTVINAPQPGDSIFANSQWTELSSVAPGPFNAVFVRTN